MENNTIDLDSLFDNLQEEISNPPVHTHSLKIDWDQILLEWSYRCPKGYPTMVDGVFVDKDEVALLNEILDQHNLPTLDIQNEAITMGDLSTNPTDVKEALVCLFVDAILTDGTIADDYRTLLDKKLDPNQRIKLVKKIRTKLTTAAKKYGRNYGIQGYAKMGDFIADTLSDIVTNKADLVTINNGLGAADAVVQNFPKTQPGSILRNEFFNQIRKHAVNLIESNYNIKGYLPDNWCPGDVYIVQDSSKAQKALLTKNLNVGANSLNNYFYGTSNTKAPIIAVSLKMQKAQAGKGTTFIKNVVVDGVSSEDKKGKDDQNKQIIKFRDLKRRLEKYYFETNDWKKDERVFDKVKQATVQLSKLTALPNNPAKIKDQKEFQKYLTQNIEQIKKAVQQLSVKLSKSIDTTTTFQQAYNRFVKNLKQLKVEKIEGDSRAFLKAIELKNKQENKGKLNATKMQEILSQKSATYDLASVLIEKWTEKTKQISPAFADYLDKVKNPFVAITMFAIAQHGLNPNFYKAIGTNNASTGNISEFPSNSVVDERKSVQNLKVVDSPGQAGFYITYLLRINNHTYSTTLTFRFSKDQIRVEVEELTAV